MTKIIFLIILFLLIPKGLKLKIIHQEIEIQKHMNKSITDRHCELYFKKLADEQKKINLKVKETK